MSDRRLGRSEGKEIDEFFTVKGLCILEDPGAASRDEGIFVGESLL